MIKDNQVLNLGIVGAGYVGSVSAAVFAEKCQNVKVTVADKDIERIKKWRSDRLPFYEPELNNLVIKNRDKNLFFTSDLKSVINTSSIIFICVNTPTKNYGIGQDRATNLEYYDSVIQEIIKNATNDLIVVNKSTVPCRTAVNYQKLVNKLRGEIRIEIFSNPEFLAEGSAIHNCIFPDRVIIGKTNSALFTSLEIIKKLYLQWVPDEKILITDSTSAELIKLASNSFLAQRVSSINSLIFLCEKLNCNVQNVAKGIGMDNRIGEKFLEPGIGFGGSCFKKDLLSFINIAEKCNLATIAEYWEGVLKINYDIVKFFLEKVFNHFLGNISQKIITIYGVSFKPATSDMRESPAILITRSLLIEGANVVIYDPKVDKESISDQILADGFKYLGELYMADDLYKAASSSAAILICTKWKEFELIDFSKLAMVMKNRLIIDGRPSPSIKEKAETFGFVVDQLGIPN